MKAIVAANDPDENSSGGRPHSPAPLLRADKAARTAVSLTVGLLVLSLATSYGSPTPKDLNTPRTFPEIQNAEQWRERAADIRDQVLVSCGLYPLPPKQPLRARVFDRVQRDGYTVEKVWFQSYPGFYVCGNLYRPTHKAGERVPAVLNPHGHRAEGRLADSKDGSHAARCIGFARMGMIAFSYDMVGYNDTFFPDHGDATARNYYVRHRRFATNNVSQLWGISQMGLQTWNTIRALDFLESLPDVDRNRIACTGESGGGTQTFMLGAVKDRLAALAPVVMVSHSMQGGCSCENAPGLRVDYSNMEISAAAAPVPQILVAATGDWTKTTPTIEGPAVARIYDLLGLRDRLHFVRFDFGHNYNQTSREAVYGWFNKWLLNAASHDPVREQPYTKEPDETLRVFPDGKLPEDAVTEAHLVHYLIGSSEAQFERMLPHSRKELAVYQRTMRPAWERTIQLSKPLNLRTFKSNRAGMSHFTLGQAATPEENLVVTVQRSNSGGKRVAVLAAEPVGSGSGDEGPIADRLLKEGWTIVRIQQHSFYYAADPFANFFTTYNRTRAQQRVGDLVEICRFAREELGAKRVMLVGTGEGGPLSILAAPAADLVVADCNALDTSNDESLLAPSVFVPGLRKLGGFEGAALLAAPRPVFLHNTAGKFGTGRLRSCYLALKSSRAFDESHTIATPDGIAKWVRGHD